MVKELESKVEDKPVCRWLAIARRNVSIRPDENASYKSSSEAAYEKCFGCSGYNVSTDPVCHSYMPVRSDNG